jgi:predicted permease
MRRFPVATLIAVLSLGAGIGAMTATITVRNAVFRRPPPLYSHPEGLSIVRLARPDRPGRFSQLVPAGLYRRWSSISGLTLAASTQERAAFDVRADDRSETVPVRAVTPELFSVLGVRPLLGNAAFTASTHDASPAVLSYGVWMQLFDRRPDVLGRVIWIENRPHSIIAVMPERFWLAEMNSPVWTPLDVTLLSADAPLDVIARRTPRVSAAALQSQLQSSALDYAATLPAGQRQIRVGTQGIEGTPLGSMVALILPYILGASVVLTLLIACANVAILLIAQWTAREHEIAIRASIGASRRRIIQALLTESVLVAAVGAVLGACVTYALRGWIVHRGLAQVRFFDLSIDIGVLAQTATIAILAGIVTGIIPAFYETRRLQANPFRAAASMDRVRQRWRDGLVVLEITLTVALLVVTSSMISGYQSALGRQMGFSSRPLMMARVVNPSGVQTLQIVDELTRVPGVAAAAAATGVPYYGGGTAVRVARDGAGTNSVAAQQRGVTPTFFSTLGVEMRSGRAFSTTDSTAARAVVVNDGLARRLFPAGAATGQRVWIGSAAYDIIGVVANYSNNPMRAELDDPQVFIPVPAFAASVTEVSILVRAAGDPGVLVETIRRHIRASASGTEVRTTFTFDQIRSVIGQEILVGTAPLIPLIAIGVLLTAAGIYGVLAFAVARRGRELAVRLALGATGRNLARLVTAHTARLVGFGSAIGIGLTFGLSRIVRASGGAGSIYDPPLEAFIVPIVIIFAIGALGTWVPSRRALNVDPAKALRTT